MDRTEKKDLAGYAFIRNQIVHTGIKPSLREIGRVVGYGSPRSVQLMLERLQRRGLLSISDGVFTLKGAGLTTSSQRTVAVPLVGSVACGLPTLAEQDPEAVVEVSTKIAKPGHRYFLLRARGNSMNKSGIQDGDLVLVRQQLTADEGERIVALINDDATIKHFHWRDGLVVLQTNSTDRTIRPIVLSDDFVIQGVVVATLPSSLCA